MPAATDYLIKAGVKRENISWIPNSVDIKNIPPQFPTKSSQKKFTVMYAGAHGLANDLDTVVAAAKILKEKGLSETLRICLIGDGPEKNRLQQLTRAEQINMIDFLPSVAKHTIYNMLHQADAYLMLLKKSPVFRWGISPNKLFDYLAMARPVIFGVETPFDPIANANAGISITPSDPQALANAIYTLSKTPTDELTAMGQRGREFVLQNHDVELLAEKLEGVLERCR